jgi:hypothetical protein
MSGAVLSFLYAAPSAPALDVAPFAAGLKSHQFELEPLDFQPRIDHLSNQHCMHIGHHGMRHGPSSRWRRCALHKFYQTNHLRKHTLHPHSAHLEYCSPLDTALQWHNPLLSTQHCIGIVRPHRFHAHYKPWGILLPRVHLLGDPLQAQKENARIAHQPNEPHIRKLHQGNGHALSMQDLDML